MSLKHISGEIIKMKAILFVSLLACALSSENPNIKAGKAHKLGPNENDTYQIIAGLLEGFPAEAHISEIGECMTNIEDISVNFNNAISALKLQTSESALQGLKTIAEAIQSMPRFIADCNPVERDLSRFYHSINVFRNPLTFNFVQKKSLAVNEVEIFWYMDQAIKFYDAQKFKDFGFYLGTCLGKVGGSGIRVVGY